MEKTSNFCSKVNKSSLQLSNAARIWDADAPSKRFVKKIIHKFLVIANNSNGMGRWDIGQLSTCRKRKKFHNFRFFHEFLVGFCK